MTTTPARAADEDPSTGPQVVMNAESRDSSRLTEIGIQNNFTGLAPVSTMRTLPRDVAAFTGRDAELRQLVAAATGAAGVVAIHTVDGMPGVGKTALVTRAAHLLADDFPDGQLFVDLHAHTPGMKPANPGEVLAGLLACTGMAPGEIPAGLEARVERWRGRLAGKKVLLVLDDAAGHAQVEPLLPGTAGCLVLVTSRHRLIALDGAQPLPLDTLPPEQANELFTRLARRPQDGSDAGTVAKLTGLCDYLPLAIALLAGRLAHHPSWDITTYSADFAAAQDRLSELPPETGPGTPRWLPPSRCLTRSCPKAGSACSAAWACIPAPTSTRTPLPPWPASPSPRPARAWTPCTPTTSSTNPSPAATACTTSSANTPGPSPPGTIPPTTATRPPGTFWTTTSTPPRQPTAALPAVPDPGPQRSAQPPSPPRTCPAEPPPWPGCAVSAPTCWPASATPPPRNNPNAPSR